MSTQINIWTRKTLDLATSKNYLDRLLEIYPATLPPERSLPENIKLKIRTLYESRKFDELLLLLIDLKDEKYPFPIEHPYASLLRYLSKGQRRRIMELNPMIAKELANLVASIGLDNIIRGVERPKDINRTLGTAFKNWLRRKFVSSPFRVVNQCKELPQSQCEGSICIYTGPDEEIGEFVKHYLKLEEPREGFYNRDLIVRIGNTYIIGEARFLSTPGGSQERDLNETLEFIKIVKSEAKSDVKAIALLDGIVWFYDSYVEKIKRVAVGDNVVMSALLLEEYLLDVFKSLL